MHITVLFFFFFFQAEDGIRDLIVTGVQTCALPILGSDAAPIEIAEYSDFECPFCASFATVQMPVIRTQLIATGKVRWRFRDFPLPTHAYSRYAALAAQCAGEQGKFWEMHDQLFTNHQWAQTGKNPRGLFRDLARGIGLDLDQYDPCMDSQ